jgi:general secretion pathway protein B
MSYILEALKKAEAEREQGSVPGLRSQAWAPNTQETPAKTWSAGRWWVMGLLLASLVGLGLWLWRAGVTAERPAMPKGQEDRVVATVPVMPSVAASQGQVPPPLVSVSPAPPPAPLAPAVVAPAPPVKVKVAKAPSPAASANDRVVKWADMTPAQRQTLAKLTWGGAMHSTDPSARMVIINDQVMREGDALGPDLVLERIEPKAVVLNLQGQRIRKDF